MKKSSYSKRFLAMFLSMIMVLGSVSAFALADDVEAEDPVSEPAAAVVAEAPAAATTETPAPAPADKDDAEDADDEAAIPADEQNADEPEEETAETPAETPAEPASEETESEETTDATTPAETVSSEVSGKAYNAVAPAEEQSGESSVKLDTDETLTVCNGDSLDAYVPVYGLYVDAYLRCHFIFPASMLEDMNGADISAMMFYSGSAESTNWSGAKFKVYLKEVTATTISTYASLSDDDLVYDGALAVQGSRLVVNFDNDYTYNGGNLLVAVECYATGNYNSCSFFGISSTGSCVRGYNYSSLSAVPVNQENFLPKTTFGYSATSAKVKTAPEAKNVDYNEKAQELVTAGVASGGKMNYAIGTSSTTAPKSGWSESVPTATDAGTYYVWYKAVGKTAGDETVPACVTSVINKVEINDYEMPELIRERTTHEEFIYKGKDLIVCDKGSAEGGEFVFSLDGTKYSTSVPAIKGPGEYELHFKIKGDKNHLDREFGFFFVVVMDYEFVSGAGSKWEKDSSSELVFTIKRSRLDELTYENVEGVYVDDEAVPGSAYNLEAGSAIITLGVEYLKTLKEGTHTIRVDFSDPYTATTTFEIVTSAPQTGEYASSFVLVVAGIMMAAGAAFVVKFRMA